MELTTHSISTGEVRVFVDPYLALDEFIVAPIADRYGITAEEVKERFDLELIFSNLTEYDSINGREGYRLRTDLSEERVQAIVEANDLQA